MNPMRAFLLLAFCTAAAAAHAEAPPIRPGLWEFAMVGLPHKQNVCLKPEMVKDIQSLAQRGEEGGDCKSSDAKTSGQQRSFKVSCTKPHKYEATVTMTVTNADNFSMQQDYSIDQNGRKQTGSMKINYRRLGDC